LIGERNNRRKEVKNVLDIGTATGHTLYSIIDNFKDAHVLGIDYNPHYVPACKKLF
jgi:methylase of polypeptide subunit release factors